MTCLSCILDKRDIHDIHDGKRLWPLILNVCLDNVFKFNDQEGLHNVRRPICAGPIACQNLVRLGGTQEDGIIHNQSCLDKAEVFDIRRIPTKQHRWTYSSVVTVSTCLSCIVRNCVVYDIHDQWTVASIHCQECILPCILWWRQPVDS